MRLFRPILPVIAVLFMVRPGAIRAQDESTALDRASAAAGNGSPQDRAATELMMRLRARYEALPGLVARFEQRTELFDETDVLAGTIYLRGERYRLETGSRTVGTDGEVVWVRDAAERQIIVSDLVEDETTFSITDFLYRFDERWRAVAGRPVTHAGEPAHELVLEPLDADDWFTRVAVILRDRDLMAVAIDVTDASDVTLSFTLHAFEERALPDSSFDVPPAGGFEVVDLRN